MQLAWSLWLFHFDGIVILIEHLGVDLKRHTWDWYHRPVVDCFTEVEFLGSYHVAALLDLNEGVVEHINEVLEAQ